MKTLRLPETRAARLHIEMFFSNGNSSCIESKRCNALQVSDDVVNVVVTPLNGDPPVHLGLQGHCLNFQHQVAFTVSR